MLVVDLGQSRGHQALDDGKASDFIRQRVKDVSEHAGVDDLTLGARRNDNPRQAALDAEFVPAEVQQGEVPAHADVLGSDLALGMVKGLVWPTPPIDETLKAERMLEVIVFASAMHDPLGSLLGFAWMIAVLDNGEARIVPLDCEAYNL
ncbi:hypothetical protein V5F79_22810 [Xanthobacter flavus]|uniref:hypothetical protein n=1 Tax=Xanthobacter flavus TaxID=281 RepID=UPI00372A7AF6